MEYFVKYFNLVICIFFTVSYSYQMVYIVVSLFGKPKKYESKGDCRYAMIIAARNEQEVIGNLIGSIKAQKYNPDLIDIYVIADNCTDQTAAVAKKLGVTVFERFNDELIGKGYALDYAFKKILASDEEYDGFFIFDADNLLDENYVSEMNNVFSNGYKVVTSYRNTKNFSDSWVSAGYSLYFMRECKFLNNARMILKTGSSVTGTGYLIHSEIIKRHDGWKHFMLTEDVQFTAECALHGLKIAYCPSAIFYDEQPTTFVQSFTQRLRWVKGGYQVLAEYGGKLLKKSFKSFYSFDILMSLMPIVVINFLLIIMNIVFMLVGLLLIRHLPTLALTTFLSFLEALGTFYLTLFAVGVITTITEWKKIKAPPFDKVIYLITFPIFVLSYMPIAIVALFKNVSWKQIKHTSVKTIEEMQ